MSPICFRTPHKFFAILAANFSLCGYRYMSSMCVSTLYIYVCAISNVNSSRPRCVSGTVNINTCLHGLSLRNKKVFFQLTLFEKGRHCRTCETRRRTPRSPVAHSWCRRMKLQRPNFTQIWQLLSLLWHMISIFYSFHIWHCFTRQVPILAFFW